MAGLVVPHPGRCRCLQPHPSELALSQEQDNEFPRKNEKARENIFEISLDVRPLAKEELRSPEARVYMVSIETPQAKQSGNRSSEI